MYKNLAKYIERLEREGELLRIKEQVDPVLEIAEITDRVAKSAGGGRALLFENTGTDFPVLTNMFGSERRMARALGVEELDDIAARIDGLLGSALAPKSSLGQKLQAVPLLADVARWFPKTVKGRGECQQVILKGSEARLSMLPVLKCWPSDGGRFVTLPLVHTVHPETGARNVGMYRMQIMGERTTGMHWHIHKTGARHYDAYKKLGIARMPVSVCLGGDPVYTYSATAPMPDGMDEYLLAGFLRRKPVKLVKCTTNDIYVPADCDFVIEGWVDTTEPKVVEGPFGDHTGFYSLADLYPTLHVTAITHRHDAIYPATLVGIPPEEDAYIARATERIFLAPIRLAIQPEVRDLYMPTAGVAHNLAIVAMETAYTGQPEKVASSLWGAHQMMFNKYLIATPAEVDIRDTEILAGLVRSRDVEQDIVFGQGVLDVLDHATATVGYGGKMLLDATTPRPERPLSPPTEYIVPEGVTVDASLTVEWRVLILRADPSAPIDLGQFVAENRIEGINLVALFDTATAELTPYELQWLGTANTDPRRDVKIAGGVLTADCRSKTTGAEGEPAEFPNVVTMDAETIALVDVRWSSYNIGALIPSPSLRYSRLLLSDTEKATR
ncbi:MAG: menaquinone biosynthesis decarboxylase [Rikenellaceae bacterium]|jgi:4-hydroxy-3-polyprenylbenzoate decarboxylase|nr:menaquinone biosynthesis decarboxylase [Rikenellaceae bacterium]